MVCSVIAASAWAQKPTARERVILVLGDSLSAEYGLKRGTGWVALLEQKLAQQNLPARIVNASISGDTTSGGRSRLAPLLSQHKPSHLILELGGNDALRGLEISQTEANLSAMITAAKDTGARVLLLGMHLPPNYGEDYTGRFAALYPKLARAHKTGLVAFFLKGVADDAQPLRWFQADRIHPNQGAQSLMMENVWPELKKLL